MSSIGGVGSSNFVDLGQVGQASKAETKPIDAQTKQIGKAKLKELVAEKTFIEEKEIVLTAGQTPQEAKCRVLCRLIEQVAKPLVLGTRGEVHKPSLEAVLSETAEALDSGKVPVKDALHLFTYGKNQLNVQGDWIKLISQSIKELRSTIPTLSPNTKQGMETHLKNGEEKLSHLKEMSAGLEKGLASLEKSLSSKLGGKVPDEALPVAGKAGLVHRLLRSGSKTSIG